MSWSYDSNYLATKNDIVPNVVWIWEISTLSLHTVIIFLNRIKRFCWSPKETFLLICTNNSKFYSFTLSKIYVFETYVDKKIDIKLNYLYWSNNGKYFVLHDKNNFIIGHPIESNEIRENIKENPKTHEYITVNPEKDYLNNNLLNYVHLDNNKDGIEEKNKKNMNLRENYQGLN